MSAHADHPLNAAGRAQAESLLQALRAGGDAASEVLGVEGVMCSPLTRAVETCLIGLEPLLLRGDGRSAADGAPRTVLLNPNLREKRNFGGKDSSGRWKGEALRAGVRGAIRELLADAPERAAALCAVPLDLTHVHEKWWLNSAEADGAVADRLAELLFQIRFSRAASQALVGHSHFFRELFRHFLAPGCTLRDAAGRTLDVAALASRKLSNAGIARCELDFDAHPQTPVVAV